MVMKRNYRQSPHSAVFIAALLAAATVRRAESLSKLATTYYDETCSDPTGASILSFKGEYGHDENGTETFGELS